MANMTLQGAAGRRGFTMIELMVVILIISVLIALSLAVGARVIEGGKVGQTRDLIKTLDNVLNSYRQSTDRLPPASILDPRVQEGVTAPVMVQMPMADAWDDDNDRPINSLGLFLAEANRVAGVSNLLEKLEAKNYRLYAYSPAPLDPAPSMSEPELMTVLDAWGNPIRFVHPAFHGVRKTAEDVVDILGPVTSPATKYYPEKIRRDPAMGDADGGLTSGQPYFYSCGPDGDPSTIEDNVYLVKPKIQK